MALWNNVHESIFTVSPTGIEIKIASPQNHNTDRLAIKINRLEEKSARYNLLGDFLWKYMQENLVPKGLEITLEPTKGNFDQKFVSNWYNNLKQLSVVLMKPIVTYIDKAEQKTEKKY